MSDTVRLDTARTPLVTLGKRKPTDDLPDERWGEMAHKISRDAPDADQPRSYVTFPRADCVLKAVNQGTLKALQKVLKQEGLLEHLKVEFTESPAPMVRFAHNKDELVALTNKHFDLYPFFGNDEEFCFFQDASPDRKPSLTGLSESPTAKRKLIRDLVEEANRYFATTPTPSPVNFTFEEGATDRERLEAVYRKFQGLCIGECHNDVAAKKFLVDNMETLRDLGVKTLFFEDYLYDTHQPLLDDYFKTPGAQPPLLLEVFQERWSEKYEFSPPYRYIDVLRKAKECGIGIVGIDTSVANEIGPSSSKKADRMERLKGMNYVAKKIIEKEKGDGKYLACMGAAHSVTMTQYDEHEPSRVVRTSPGMADLLQCPLIVMEDADDDQMEQTLVNLADSPDEDRGWFNKHVHLYLMRPV